DSYGSRASQAHGLHHKKRPPAPRRSAGRAELPVSADGFDALRGRVSFWINMTSAKTDRRPELGDRGPRSNNCPLSSLHQSSEGAAWTGGDQASQAAVVSVADGAGLAQRRDTDIELERI